MCAILIKEIFMRYVSQEFGGNSIGLFETHA